MGEVANIPQLRFPEFSNEWEESKVGKVFKVSAGGDIKTENVSQIKTDGFPYPIYANAEKAKGLYGYSNLYKSEANVVTVAGRGVNIGIAHVRLEPFYPIVRLLVLNPIKDADVKFWENQLNQLNLFVESTGVPQLTAPQISSYKVKYPSKPEQQKIAAFLTAVDNKIEQLSKKQELLGEYKKGLMQQIFSQAIRFKADDGSDFPDWKEKKLENVLKRTSTGLNPRQNFKLGYGENYYVTIKNISNGKLDFSKCERIDENAMTMIANRSDLSKGDLIMSSIGNVGESYLLDKEPENWNINESVFMLRASELMLPQFLYFIITNEQSKWYLESNSTGSSFKSIKLGELKLLPLGLPSLEEQTKIANFLSSIDTKIEQVGKQLDESKQFKKALLQQMFV